MTYTCIIQKMNILKLLTTVGFFTLLSRLTGFVRSMLLAFFLGASVTSDALLVSIRISNFLRKILAEGAFNACFVPIFSKILNTKGHEKAEELASKAYSILLFTTVIITIFTVIFYGYVLKTFAPGFNGERLSLSLKLGRICFPFIISTCIVSLISGVLNTLGKFAIPSFLQALVNIGSIVAITLAFLFNFDYATSVAIGFLITGTLQVIIIQTYAAKFNFHFHITKNLISPEIKQVIKKMIPSTLSSGVWQINLLIDSQVASLLSTGAISYIFYADQIIQLPLSTLGIAIGSALIPVFSKSIQTEKIKELKLSFNKTLILSIGFGLPASAAFFCLSEPIVSFITGRGAFLHKDVLCVASVLKIFSLALPAYILNKIITSLFFAYSNTKIPFKSTIINLVTNVIGLFLFVPHLSYNGIALSNVIAAYVSIIYLYTSIPKRISIMKFTKKILLKQFLATVCLAISMIYSNSLLPDFFYFGFLKKFSYLSIIIIFHIALYYFLGILFKFINNNKIVREFKK